MSEEQERNAINTGNRDSAEETSLVRIKVSFSPENNSFNHRNFNLRQQLLHELERLRSIMAGEGDPYEKLFHTLSREKQEQFKEFYKNFSICPICSAENHKSYLLKLFLSKNPQNQKLKQSLLRIYRTLEQNNKDMYENLNLGIPCCKCYSKLIKKPR